MAKTGAETPNCMISRPDAWEISECDLSTRLEAVDCEPVIYKGELAGRRRNCRMAGIEPPVRTGRRVVAAVCLDEMTGEIRHDPYRPGLPFAPSGGHPPIGDFPQRDLSEYAREADEAVTGCPTLKTARKHGAGRWQMFDEDEAVRARGGDRCALISSKIF